MMTNAGNTKERPPSSPPHQPPRAYARKIPSCVAVAPGTMFATARPSRKRSFDTHWRRCCSSACMMPMMAGPPYEVAPSSSIAVAISFESPLAGAPDGDTDVSLVRCVLDRVVQHVADALSEDARIALRGDASRDLCGERLVPVVGEHAEAFRHAGDQLPHVDARADQGNAAGLGP